MVPIIFIAVISILDLVFIILRNKVNEKVGIAFKMLSSFNFILLGIICYLYNSDIDSNYTKFIFLALGFGFLGDFVLGIRRLVKHKNIYLLTGLLLYLVGHIMYISAFVKLGKIDHLMLTIITLSLFIIAVIIGFKCKFVFKKLKYGIISYVLTSSILLSLAITILLSSQNITISNMVNAIASLLFVLSDTALCFIYFKKYNNNTRTSLTIVSSILYLFAQNIFAFSLFLI
jgi:uncharacterized membrane protein YhhN